MFFFQKPYPSQYKAEVNKLTAELMDIGKREDFLSEHPGGQFDSQCRNIRAREIGSRLHEIGDVTLMEYVAKKVAKKMGNDLAAHIEFCWLRIGGF